MTLRWRHNGCDSVSNHQPHHCLLNRLFRRTSKKTSKLRVTGLCAGNSPVTGEFPAHRASNPENVSIWWRHHGIVAMYLDSSLSTLVEARACPYQHQSIYPTREDSSLNAPPNGCQFADSILKVIFLCAKCYILFQMSAKIVAKCPFNNKPALGQIMDWQQVIRRPNGSPVY